MNLKAIFILICIITISCSEKKKIIHYRYNNVEIRRIDYTSKTKFHYVNSNQQKGTIWVEYSGINDGFSGFLKFENNGMVTLLSGDGHFQNDNKNSKFNFKRIIYSENPLMGSDGVYFIELSTKFEQEKNNRYKSKVSVKYY